MPASSTTQKLLAWSFWGRRIMKLANTHLRFFPMEKSSMTQWLSSHTTGGLLQRLAISMAWGFSHSWNKLDVDAWTVYITVAHRDGPLSRACGLLQDCFNLAPIGCRSVLVSHLPGRSQNLHKSLYSSKCRTYLSQGSRGEVWSGRCLRSDCSKYKGKLTLSCSACPPLWHL